MELRGVGRQGVGASPGSFQMPTQANGNRFDPALDRARGDYAEVTLNVLPGGAVIRVLGYVNHAQMGDYRIAI